MVQQVQEKAAISTWVTSTDNPRLNSKSCPPDLREALKKSDYYNMYGGKPEVFLDQKVTFSFPDGAPVASFILDVASHKYRYAQHGFPQYDPTKATNVTSLLTKLVQLYPKAAEIAARFASSPGGENYRIEGKFIQQELENLKAMAKKAANKAKTEHLESTRAKNTKKG